jgi:hypothetical protein
MEETANILKMLSQTVDEGGPPASEVELDANNFSRLNIA